MDATGCNFKIKLKTEGNLKWNFVDFLFTENCNSADLSFFNDYF